MPDYPNELLLHDKRVLVTGASSGIGLATARWLARLGASLILVGRRLDALEKLVSELPGSGHRAMRVDLTFEKDRQDLAEESLNLDGLVHAAGFLRIIPLTFLQEAHLREVAMIHLEAPLLLVSSLVKRKKISVDGSLVFISSVAAQSGALGHAAYAGAKAAMEGAARSMALEMASRRIRVNCLAPGMVRTPLMEGVEKTLGREALNKHEKSYPLGFGTPENVAHAVGFLLSPAASWITGTVMTCDGGFTAGRP